jgi:hypothetical protein
LALSKHHGVPLKDLHTTRPGEPIDWDEMAKFAASLLPDDDARRLAGWCDGDDEDATEAPDPTMMPAGDADTCK